MPAQNDTTKHIEIVAGPKGSGKTTFAQLYFNKRKNTPFLNADKIALGLSLTNAKRFESQATHVMRTAIKNALTTNQSLAFESTLLDKTWLPILRTAIKKGYQLTIYFISFEASSLNQKGSHRISNKKDSALSKYNFWTLYRPISNNWFTIDNSGKKPKQTYSKSDFEDLSSPDKKAFEENFLKHKKNPKAMKKQSNSQKALLNTFGLFPKTVKENRLADTKRKRFADETFGELAREVHRQVLGDKTTSRS